LDRNHFEALEQGTPNQIYFSEDHMCGESREETTVFYDARRPGVCPRGSKLSEYLDIYLKYASSG